MTVLVGGLDGALVCLGAGVGGDSLLWRAGSLSAAVACALNLSLSLVLALSQRAYPQIKSWGAAERFAWGSGALGAIISALISAQWGLTWAHSQLRRESYQALALGVIILGTLALWGLIIPLWARGALKVTARLWPHTHGGDLAWPGRLLWLALSFSALAVAPQLWSPLATLPLAPVALLIWALWLWSLAPSITARLSSRSLSYLALIAALWMMTGLERSARALSSAEARLISQRGLWASRALTLGRQLTDRDGDGRAALFAGGDCDEGSRRVRAGAYEPVGRDLNCDGFKRERAPSWRAQLKPTATRSPLALRRLGAEAPRHLFLITVDALRADAYEGEMPKTKAFAARAARFKRAYSAGAATYWSLPTLIGSKPPSAFKMGRDQTPTNQERLLFEALRDSSFHTALLSNVTIFFVRGLSQGALTKNYDTSRFTHHGERPGAAHMTKNILKHVDLWRARALKPHRSRLALWAHYYDPHDPYFRLNTGRFASDQERYLATVRALDDSLEELWRGLEERGMLDDSAIVFSADHGDEFGEHGGRHHGRTLYEEMVHVPLWVYSPNLRALEVQTPISHLDLAPTLLSLLGLRGERSFEGSNWLGAEPPLGLAFFEVLPDRNYQDHLVGLVSDEGWKLIYDQSHASFELYHLGSDPQERYDLAGWLTEGGAPAEHAQRLQQLKTALLSYASQQLTVLARGESGVKKPWGSP